MLGLKQKLLAAAIDIRANHRQSAQRDAGQVIWHKVQKLWVGTGDTRMHAAFGLHTGAQGSRRTLELLIRDKAGDKDLAKRVAVQVRKLFILILVQGRLDGFIWN